jgi:hypothetical protein
MGVQLPRERLTSPLIYVQNFMQNRLLTLNVTAKTTEENKGVNLQGP